MPVDSSYQAKMLIKQIDVGEDNFIPMYFVHLVFPPVALRVGRIGNCVCDEWPALRVKSVSALISP